MKPVTETISSSRRETSWLSWLAWPVLACSALFLIWLALQFRLSFALCNVLFLFWTIGWLAWLEYRIPAHRQWQADAAEWRRDAIYLLLTMSGGALALPAVYALARCLPHYQASLAMWQQLLCGLLLSSLGSYLFHRLSHHQPWLWKLHGIHHADDHVNVGNNGVNHVLDVFGRRLLAQTPLLLLGLSAEAMFMLSMFSTLQGYFVHANIRASTGWLAWLLVTPEQHRLHHSNLPQEAGHYSTDITLWDWLFGSFTWRPGRLPHGIGLFKPALFPSPDAIRASQLHPWRKWPPS